MGMGEEVRVFQWGRNDDKVMKERIYPITKLTGKA